MSPQKTVLITGASRGIGQAIAEAFAAGGYAVIGTATTAAGASSISDHLARHGSGHLGLQVNVAEPESLREFYAALEAQQRQPLILVNNAGITRDNLLLRMKDEEWHAVIETNLNSVFRLCRQFSRAMIKARFGRIINISSVVGGAGNGGQANYAAAKAGVGGLTRSLAQEVASRNITVNAIAPGLIETDMTRALTAAQQAQALSRVPAGRFGTGAEIASLALYLASDLAAYITGETIQVNGGMYMT